MRIGTAEIYRQAERIEQVLESLVIGQQWKGDVRVVLFVRLREGELLDDPLRARICSEIRQNTTPRHVPAKVIRVAENAPEAFSRRIGREEGSARPSGGSTNPIDDNRALADNCSS